MHPKPQLTLAFESLQELAEFLARVTEPARTRVDIHNHVVIPAVDRPDAGLDTAAIFGGGAPAAPLAQPIPAPSTAAVVPPPTVPEAPPASSSAPSVCPAPAAPTAPVAAAPTAPAAPSSPAGVELDKNGLPWDARIHSESRNKVADGSWRQRRNLDPTVKANVEAELRHLMALNAGGAPAVPPAAPPAPPPAAAVPQPPTPAPAPAAVPGASPSSPAPADIGALLTKLAPHFASGALTQAQADAVCQKHGLQNLSQAVLTPALVPALAADFEALLA